jgi:hypothetical protein
MKPRKVLRRQVFVLTPEEKRAVACVLGAFLLGLGTMHYRAKHPRPQAAPAAKEEGAAKGTAAATKRQTPSPTPGMPPAELDDN